MWRRPLLLSVLFLVGCIARGQADVVFKIGGAYFVNCETLVGSEGAVLLNVGTWKGAATDVDMDVRGEHGRRVAIVRDGRLISGDTARYRIHHDKVTFALWDVVSGRVICMLRPSLTEKIGNTRGIDVWLDVFTSNGSFFHCDPEHSDLAAMELERSNRFLGKKVGLELD